MAQAVREDLGAPAELSENVGHRIRAFREMRALSQRALGLAAGVSPSFLSQLENGHSSASIGSLRRITAALGISLADLFDPSLQQPRALLRARNRPQLPMEAGSRKYVISRAPIQNVEIYVAEFDPGGSTGSELYTHGDSQEFLIVTKGEVTFFLGSEQHLMATGDSIEYRTSVPHGLRNHSTLLAEVVWTTSPPTGSELPSDTAQQAIGGEAFVAGSLDDPDGGAYIQGEQDDQ